MTPEQLALRTALWLAKEIGDSGPAFIREIALLGVKAPGSPETGLAFVSERTEAQS